MENCTNESNCYHSAISGDADGDGTGPVLAMTIGIAVLVLFIFSCVIGCCSVCFCYAKKLCCFKVIFKRYQYNLTLPNIPCFHVEIDLVYLNEQNIRNWFHFKSSNVNTMIKCSNSI